MLDKYLEKELQRKIKIIIYLWRKNCATSAQLAEELEVTSATIKSDIKIINHEYCKKNNPLIVSSITGYSILNKENRNKKKYLIKIYKSSTFVQATCFFLKHDFSQIIELEKEIYISQAKAYDIKNKVRCYFEELRILKDGRILPDAELRIRFLMAFFQWEIGMEIVDISSNTRNIYESFFKEVESLEKCMFSDRSKEYAHILFQISFLRRNKKALQFTKDECNFIKETMIYKRLKIPIQLFLKSRLRFSIFEEEMIFFAIVFNIMNANYYDIHSETYNSYVTLIKETEFINYPKLIQAFEESFEVSFKENLIFQASIVNFLRKCFLNLQTFIPEEHLSSGQSAKIPKKMLTKTKSALKAWLTNTKLTLEFSEAHILQLTSKIFFISRKKARPKRIYLLTSFYTDFLLGKEVLTHEYGALAEIHLFNPTLQKNYTQEDLILYDSYYDILNQFSSKKQKINYIFDLEELQKIRALLFSYNLKGMKGEDYYDINNFD